MDNQSSYPSANMDEFLVHSLPRFYCHHDPIRGTYEFVLKHPSREIAIREVFTTKGFATLIEKETFTNDDMATSDGFLAVTVRLMEKYLEMLRKRQYLEVPRTSELLRALITGDPSYLQSSPTSMREDE